MISSTVSHDVGIVSEAILTLFDVVSFFFLCIVYYLVFVGNAINLRFWRRRQGVVAVLIANPLVAAICIVPPHIFAQQKYLLLAVIFLGWGIVAYGVFYFAYFKKFIRSADFRIQNTVMMWAATAALTVSALLLLYLGSDLVKLNLTQAISYENLIQSASILISALGIAFTYVMKSEQTNRNSKQQLYQTLELQSIELFRFECAYPDLVRQLWYDDAPPPRSDRPQDPRTSHYCLRQYVCQMLNLFEMATRFRTLRVLPEEVFGSWVIWIWELCNCKQFQDFWLDDDDLPSNYVRDLRDVMTAGVRISLSDGMTDEEKRRKFFSEVAEQLNCWEIEQWFVRRPDIELSRLLHFKRSHAAAGAR
ncbi:hypothetical protein C2U70_06785 [Bradyrhizobium guangdongense]|uniref:hypothetical protein n=1 Tax=Bradyrhizobium guangdongense TaxID=1325090 RepID=UPI0011276967|nr:hypothetical protein [Bradyrhizobium guangdongense]TPQ39735.1 hypothetical protein C2U70_06785 [Bradyrhizobium guangdongense]